MLLTVSAKASSLCGPFNIGSTKPLLFWAIGQNAQSTLVTCKSSELLTGSQYRQTTRLHLKTGLLLIFHVTIVFFFSRYKLSYQLEMDQPSPSTPNSSYSEMFFSVSVLIKVNSRHSRKIKVVKIELKFPSRNPSGFWNPDEERSYRLSGRLIKLSQYPFEFSGSLR